MSLLKFFLSQATPGKVAQRKYAEDEDLFDHPDIATMSQRELADLPLPIPAPRRSPQTQTGSGSIGLN
ncbi:hypothetical protein FHX08_002493 [Rhizobium sp. BK529]|uniref:hypothetical protein n=1 Tax=unclassified Rhizobium TaxID=2613769 RepID=UPI001047B796|nr:MULTISPECIES: hypothetical protein [unclassified Rhizobium]MBB3592149.1 hypothetical protein [Rhizobium sp. BK529]